MGEWPSVIIIVHNFKGLGNLKKCLSALMKTDYPNYKIIVVDALTKSIKKWIKNTFPSIKVIHFDYDAGIPARLNAALNIIDKNTKYIARLDDDIIVHPKWLKILVRIMEQCPTIGMAQPIMLKPALGKCTKIDCLGGFLDQLGFNYLLPSTKFSFKKLEPTYAVAGLIRREAIEKISKLQKPFDEDYFIHWYDVDFSWRLRLAGYRIVLVPNSIVYHERRLTRALSRLPSKNIFLNTRNAFITLLKNYNLANILRYVPLRVMFNIIMSLILLKKKRYDHSLAILLSIYWVLRNLQIIWQKRICVQKYIRNVPDSRILKTFNPINIKLLIKQFYVHYPSN